MRKQWIRDKNAVNEKTMNKKTMNQKNEKHS